VAKVVRARKGLVGDGRKLTANNPDRDVVLILKVRGFPGVRGSVLEWSNKSYILADRDRCIFQAMIGVEGDTTLRIGAVVPREAQTLTLYLDGLEPMPIEVPAAILDQGKI
jgi:hypothetical protein